MCDGATPDCPPRPGATVDWALTLIDDACYRELGYSALGRVRHATELYLTGIDPESPNHQPPGPSPDPDAALAESGALFGTHVRSRDQQVCHTYSSDLLGSDSAVVPTPTRTGGDLSH